MLDVLQLRSEAIAYTKAQELESLKEKIGTVSHWYHRVEVAPGVFTPGMNDCHDVLAKLELPEDCNGLRVLDIGARDGFFSIMLERGGAKEVIALDHVSPDKTVFLFKRIFLILK